LFCKFTISRHLSTKPAIIRAPEAMNIDCTRGHLQNTNKNASNQPGHGERMQARHDKARHGTALLSRHTKLKNPELLYCSYIILRQSLRCLGVRNPALWWYCNNSVQTMSTKMSVQGKLMSDPKCVVACSVVVAANARMSCIQRRIESAVGRLAFEAWRAADS
jgi:hypothetical protein